MQRAVISIAEHQMDLAKEAVFETQLRAAIAWALLLCYGHWPHVAMTATKEE